MEAERAAFWLHWTAASLQVTRVQQLTHLFLGRERGEGGGGGGRGDCAWHVCMHVGPHQAVLGHLLNLTTADQVVHL